MDVEAGEFFVADRALGDIHPHGVDVGGRGGARFVAEDAGADLAADEGHQALGFVVAGDDEEDVALLDAFVFFGEGDFAVAREAGDGEAGRQDLPHGGDGFAGKHRVVHLQRDAGDGGGSGAQAAQGQAFFGGDVDAEAVFDEEDGGNQPHHAAGVGGGVTSGHLYGEGAVADEVGQGLLGGAEAGGVGDRALHDADQRRQVVVGKAEEGEDDEDVKEDDDEHQRVQFQPFFLEGGEKARADLQADGVNEQNQPEFFDEMGDVFVYREAEVGDDDAGE